MSHHHRVRATLGALLTAALLVAALATTADAKVKSPPRLTKSTIPLSSFTPAQKPAFKPTTFGHRDTIVNVGGYGSCGLDGYKSVSGTYQASSGTWIGWIEWYGQQPDCSYYVRYDYYYWTGYWQVFGHYSYVDGVWAWRDA